MQDFDLVGWIVEWIVYPPVSAVIGAMTYAMAVKIWKHFQRKRLAPRIEVAYGLVQRVCEPETLNPERPGNMPHMKHLARDYVNPLRNRLNKAGFFPPAPCTVEDQSLQDWFRFLGNVRIEIG